jgi:hypothetical protein
MFKIMYKKATEAERTGMAIMLGFSWTLCIIALVKYIAT